LILVRYLTIKSLIDGVIGLLEDQTFDDDLSGFDTIHMVTRATKCVTGRRRDVRGSLSIRRVRSKLAARHGQVEDVQILSCLVLWQQQQSA